MVAIGYKHRQWEAFISVSASGPEYSSVFERNGCLIRSRMAADLEYTTADVDFLYDHFSAPEPDRPRQKALHVRLVNPTKERVLGAFSEIADWFQSFRTHPDWDGGGLHFSFAGHGAENGGAIVLDGGTLTADEFLEQAETVATRISKPGRLRLSVVLDSCHSGAWVTRILHSCFHERGELLVPFNLFASCMHDEVAFEDSSLGHGLFTYCFSIKPVALGSFGATALLPDNSTGPSLSLAAGVRGCSLLSAGAQNPVAYWNGAGQLEVSQVSFSVMSQTHGFMNENEMRDTLNQERAQVRDVLRMARPELLMSLALSDEETRISIRRLLASLQQQLE